MEVGKNQGFGKNLYVFGKIKSFLGKLPKKQESGKIGCVFGKYKDLEMIQND